MARLVPDWQTNCVTLALPTKEMHYYNDHLPSLRRFYFRFVRVLLSAGVRVICIVPDLPTAKRLHRGTGIPLQDCHIAPVLDIWLRDFAPVQTENGLVKFLYRPRYLGPAIARRIEDSFMAYLNGYLAASPAERTFLKKGRSPHLSPKTSAASRVLGEGSGGELSYKKVSPEAIPLSHCDLVLDGGNLTTNGKVLILTERVLKDNPDRSEREITHLLRSTFDLDQVVLVPEEPGDKTGHIDGMVRWLSENHLLVNDCRSLSQSYAQRLMNSLSSQLPGTRITLIPYQLSRDKHKGWPDLAGNYTNFLLTKKATFVPIYGIPLDQEAKRILRTLFGSIPAEFVQSTVISCYGGALNCITWNY